MVSIPYIFKPKKVQVDAVAETVKELAPRMPGLNISQIYEFAVDRALADYRRSPQSFERELQEYLDRQATL